MSLTVHPTRPAARQVDAVRPLESAVTIRLATGQAVVMAKSCDPSE